MAYCCFMQGCELEVQYVCQCLSSVTYFCEFHLQAHLKLPNRTHSFDSILTEPSEFTKDIVLKFLEKIKAKKEKLRKIAKASFNKNQKNTKNSIKSSLNDLNSDLEEIHRLIEKISQVEEKDFFNLLTSQYDADKNEAIQLNDSEEYAEVRLFCQSSQLRNKKFGFLNRANNNPEIEQDFRKTCELYKNHASNSLLSQVYHEYINEYQKFTSTYFIDEKANFYYYNTEKEKEKYILIPKAFNYHSSLTQLPNGELFIIGCKKSSQIAFILDKNHQIRNLPYGAPARCFNAIYYNRSIYCFGKTPNHWNHRKFDLEKNRWIELTPIKKSIYYYFNSVIFNRNMLISTGCKRSILLYSIDIDSFSKIPYKFAGDRKILMSAETRLYLFEANEWIYESEDEYNWKRIAKSTIEDCQKQVCCSYNKGGIYISVLNDECRNYFKFDLNQKTLIEIGFYSENFSLQRSGYKFETIKYHDNTLEISNHPTNYIDNSYTLNSISNTLKELNQKIKYSRNLLDAVWAWTIKGNTLCDLGIYHEGIQCYNNAIKFNPNHADAYNNKGLAFQMLGKHIEAIECFNKTIEIDPNYAYAYSNKGNALCNLERNLEAIECLNEAIKIEIDESTFYKSRGNIFKKLGREEEAFMDFFKADELRKTSK